MASRTFRTTDDVDAALNFLGRQARPPVSGEEYLQGKINDVVTNVMKEADEKRFSLVRELMDDANKGQSISKLRELLGTA